MTALPRPAAPDPPFAIGDRVIYVKYLYRGRIGTVISIGRATAFVKLDGGDFVTARFGSVKKIEVEL